MKLHEQRNELESRLKNVKQGIEEITDYLHSSKFNGEDPFDKYVNRDDILQRLAQLVNPHLLGPACNGESDMITTAEARKLFIEAHGAEQAGYLSDTDIDKAISHAWDNSDLLLSLAYWAEIYIDEEKRIIGG